MNDNYKKLIENLKLMACQYNEQINFYDSFVDVPDDVISSFENAFLFLPSLVESNKLTIDSIASILRLNNKVQWCLRNIDLDDFSNPEWNKVREMARDTLKVMGESIEKPDTNYI